MILMLSILFLFSFLYFRHQIKILKEEINFLIDCQNIDDFWKEVDSY